MQIIKLSFIFCLIYLQFCNIYIKEFRKVKNINLTKNNSYNIKFTDNKQFKEVIIPKYSKVDAETGEVLYIVNDTLKALKVKNKTGFLINDINNQFNINLTYNKIDIKYYELDTLNNIINGGFDVNMKVAYLLDENQILVYNLMLINDDEEVLYFKDVILYTPHIK